MSVFRVETKAKDDPQGKPRVYFTCHPEDLSACYARIRNDLFEAQNCAVYRTEDLWAPIPEADLGRMNLVVVPVTLKLLTQPSRAMDHDLAFAKAKNIPILPILMESGLEELYSLPEKFGERQYLDPNSSDPTAIGYREKLKKYLQDVLVSDETAARIRAAFDGTLFLSYRKKDRQHANRLMRMIHNCPGCRDIAVWFDEFLTPGESFAQNIQKALKRSRLFLLLVTPNLLEYPEGKPNFVMRVEYPEAEGTGMPILPVEMEATDRKELEEKYPRIPDCLTADDEARFRRGLLRAVEPFARPSNDDDPEHRYLIGMAYLKGIDMETDRERGLALITSAAERDFPEAMLRLRTMYTNGADVPLNYDKAEYWARKLTELLEQMLGKTCEETLIALNQWVDITGKKGDWQAMQALARMSWERHAQALGEAHEMTLYALNQWAAAEHLLGNHPQALKLSEQCYKARRELLGEAHPTTLVALDNLAEAYAAAGDFRKACEIRAGVYGQFCRVCGEGSPDTLIAMDNYAMACLQAGDYPRALELSRQVCALCDQMLGAEHPQTLQSRMNLAAAYRMTEDMEASLAIARSVYDTCRRVLGACHPHTLHAMNAVGLGLCHMDQNEEALPWCREVYDLRRATLGEAHPETLVSANNLSMVYGNLGRHKEAISLSKQSCALREKILGRKHPQTLNAKSNLAVYYFLSDQRPEAIALAEEVYRSRYEVLGQTHPETLDAMEMLAYYLAEAGNTNESMALTEALLACRREVNGSDHPKTMSLMERLIPELFALCRAGEALELLNELYLIHRKNNGSTHPQTLSALHRFAAACFELEDPRAMPMLEQLYRHYYGLLKANDPRMKEIYEMLCTLYYFEIDCDEDAEDREFRYAIHRNALGSEHPTTLTALDTLASYYLWDRSDTARGLELYELLYDLRKRLPDQKARDIACAVEGLTEACIRAGQLQRALKLAWELVEIHTRWRGKDSPYVEGAMEYVDEIRQLLQDQTDG